MEEDYKDYPTIDQQRAEVLRTGAYVYYIESPCEEIQLLAVEHWGGHVDGIEFPTYAVQLKVIYQNPKLAKYIRNIDPDILTLAILMGYNPEVDI